MIGKTVGTYSTSDSLSICCWSWDVCAYAVDPPTKEYKYHSIDTGREHLLFTYNKSFKDAKKISDKVIVLLNSDNS